MSRQAYYFLSGEQSQFKLIAAQSRFAEDFGKTKGEYPIHTEISQDNDLTNPKTVDWAYWGVDNDLPQKIVETVSDNAVAMGLLELRADLNYGQGIWLHKIVGKEADGLPIKEPVDNPEIEDFLEANKAHAYFLEAFDDYEYFGNIFTELRKNKAGKIGFINHIDAADIRTSNRLNLYGKSDNFYFHHDWRNYRKAEIKKIVAFNSQWETEWQIPNKSIYHAKNYLSTSKFYGVPSYLGGKRWMKVSSRIPDWHDVNLDNSWNIKYHVEIDSDYFDRNFPDLNDEEKAKQEELFKKSLSKYLSGIENVGKAFVSKFIWDTVLGKEMATVKITPLKNETNHEAYLPLFTQSNSAICSALRISPAIAPIDTGNSLSSADKYVEFAVHSSINTLRARMKAIEVFDEIWKYNGWDKKIKLGFINLTLKSAAEKVAQATKDIPTPNN